MHYRNFILGLLFVAFSCSNRPDQLTESRTISYPSGSGMEFFNGQLFVMGDDATHLLMLDSNLAILDSLQLFTSSQRRIPKDIKADLESIAVVRFKDSTRLLLTGSGSLPSRNSAWLIDPKTNDMHSLPLDTFYARLKDQIKEVNIEGACFFAGSIILANRGNKSFPRNYLIVTTPGFWTNQARSLITLIKMGANEDTSQFQGVSGLTYSRTSDKMLLSVSTEDTRSAYEDGAIGKSYLWIVDNVSTKRRWKAINPNRIIDLEAIDNRFKSQKIESVSILSETKRYFHLALVADNDDGSSTLFKLLIKK